ncbi:hypothetical protein MTX26_10840 [Bradyrhizobium sp. ISRA443]|uniref:hypothetical protein n=1 Tax=unclassified Bradyrhizobium TaxID=2631580 RepID=UPI002479DCBB|nr:MULTISPECIES: hypothetical protein [unclassified Bradyrhizobium]WGS01273.1 hypothetical protein MTX23_10835 [Bradyrhizobium sp. ISRA436]WGS08160.1 hypothetical protein MTX18_10840 [Bradyrhizobium sp. ISRA437]WGS15048.1 hypothetical protein MTX26_10840 [Bradyrhizobium sp. ISRA443]
MESVAALPQRRQQFVGLLDHHHVAGSTTMRAFGVAASSAKLRLRHPRRAAGTRVEILSDHLRGRARKRFGYAIRVDRLG